MIKIFATLSLVCFTKNFKNNEDGLKRICPPIHCIEGSCTLPTIGDNTKKLFIQDFCYDFIETTLYQNSSNFSIQFVNELRKHEEIDLEVVAFHSALKIAVRYHPWDALLMG